MSQLTREKISANEFVLFCYTLSVKHSVLSFCTSYVYASGRSFFIFFTALCKSHHVSICDLVNKDQTLSGYVSSEPLSQSKYVYVKRIQKKQESPPAWTQEAYRPRRIKYYSVGWGNPHRVPGGTRGGVPPPGQVWWRGGVYPRWGTPHQGIPRPGLTGGVSEVGYPPAWTWLGYPPTWTWLGYPPSTWTWLGTPLPGPGWGTPSCLDLAGVSPPPGVPPRWGQTDGWMDGWTDTCENITFPSYYVRGR